jgi:hypothetical protein
MPAGDHAWHERHLRMMRLSSLRRGENAIVDGWGGLVNQ